MIRRMKKTLSEYKMILAAKINENERSDINQTVHFYIDEIGETIN